MVRALQIVKSGAIGKVVTVDYRRGSDYPPYAGGPLPPQYRQGGYPFRDLGVHALYLVQAFLGPIQNVDAQFATRSGNVLLLYDEWRALVNCAGGTGQVQLSWNVHPLQHVLVVQGTHGVVRADLISMHVTTKRTMPLPKAMERALLGSAKDARSSPRCPPTFCGSWARESCRTTVCRPWWPTSTNP